MYLDSNNRYKQTSVDSNSLINTIYDSSSINKSNGYEIISLKISFKTKKTRDKNAFYSFFFSNINNRSNQISQQDIMTRSDNGFEYPNSPLLSLKRRAITNSTLFSNRSTERLSSNSRMVYSNSINGLNNSNTTVTGMMRQNPDDSFDILSLNRQIRPTFDIITDQQSDKNDDHQQEYDRKSQISDSVYDDQQTTLSVDKKRKQMITTKLFKPFYNIRFRKKNNVS